MCPAGITSGAGVRNTEVIIDGVLSLGTWGQAIYLQGGDVLDVGLTGRIMLGAGIQYPGIEMGVEAGFFAPDQPGRDHGARGHGHPDGERRERSCRTTAGSAAGRTGSNWGSTAARRTP